MIPTLRTDPALLAHIRAATKRELTRAEVRAQRISWVAGMSDLPREEIARIIDHMDGAVP